MRRPLVRTLVLALLLVFAALEGSAQEKLDLQMLDRIRAEGLQNSKIVDFLIYLCDVYAPRLPASPQYVQAGEWVVGKAKELGLANAALETYGTFGRSWELQKYYAAMTAPQYMPLIGYPKAWTPGTNGVLKGLAVLLQPKTVADLDKYKGKLKDAIVLTQGEQDMTISFDPMAARLLETDLAKLMLAPEPGVRRAQNPQMQDA
ncbi:MAG: peptidase M28, partial [Acidobacteria bacterium]|nr:peptidase M28 [Acidobacteriota bacterium]